MFDFGGVELFIFLIGIGLGSLATILYLIVFGKDDEDVAED